MKVVCVARRLLCAVGQRSQSNVGVSWWHHSAADCFRLPVQTFPWPPRRSSHGTRFISLFCSTL